jgi:hypothetical protein
MWYMVTSWHARVFFPARVERFLPGVTRFEHFLLAWRVGRFYVRLAWRVGRFYTRLAWRVEHFYARLAWHVFSLHARCPFQV